MDPKVHFGQVNFFSIEKRAKFFFAIGPKGQRGKKTLASFLFFSSCLEKNLVLGVPEKFMSNPENGPEKFMFSEIFSKQEKRDALVKKEKKNTHPGAKG